MWRLRTLIAHLHFDSDRSWRMSSPNCDQEILCVQCASDPPDARLVGAFAGQAKALAAFALAPHRNSLSDGLIVFTPLEHSPRDLVRLPRQD